MVYHPTTYIFAIIILLFYKFVLFCRFYIEFSKEFSKYKCQYLKNLTWAKTETRSGVSALRLV